MKIKFGAIVVAGSGKIGGHVASKNRGGAYLRTKVTPSNPQTPDQSNARGILASLSTGWSLLTSDQRASWNNAVKDFATTDIFGDIKNPSGINLFVKLNANLINSNQGQITTAPAKMEIPAFTISSVLFDVSESGDGLITLSNSNSDSLQAIISATPKVTAGTSYVKNLFRIIDANTIDGTDLGYQDSYIAKFGELVVGDKFFVRVETVLANGQKSVAVTFEAFAVA